MKIFHPHLWHCIRPGCYQGNCCVLKQLIVNWVFTIKIQNSNLVSTIRCSSIILKVQDVTLYLWFSLKELNDQFPPPGLMSSSIMFGVVSCSSPHWTAADHVQLVGLVTSGWAPQIRCLLCETNICGNSEKWCGGNA